MNTGMKHRNNASGVASGSGHGGVPEPTMPVKTNNLPSASVIPKIIARYMASDNAAPIIRRSIPIQQFSWE
jgi:hypothetical protein